MIRHHHLCVLFHGCHVVNPFSKVAMDAMGDGGDTLECRFLRESLEEGGEVWVILRLEIATRNTLEFS